jgi:peptidoglycan/xylan/chitin deacetylase (PgdA/CDA1 family)
VDVHGQVTKWPLQTYQQRRIAYDGLNKYIKPLDLVARNQIISGLLNWAGLPKSGRKDYRCMTEQELRSFVENDLFEIGSHTMSHCKLSSQNKDQKQREIVQSKHKLESILGKKVVSFSYPFGGAGDVDDETIRMVKQAGYEYAVANVPGTIGQGANPYWLPRCLVRNWNQQEFRQKLHSFMELKSLEVDMTVNYN